MSGDLHKASFQFMAKTPQKQTDFHSKIGKGLIMVRDQYVNDGDQSDRTLYRLGDVVLVINDVSMRVFRIDDDHRFRRVSIQ